MKSLLCALVLLVGLSAFGQASIKRNYFTTNQDPQLTFTNGTLVSTNIYVSNLFATNVTFNYITNINEFRGRTTITTNLYTTNAVIQFLTNNYFYTTNVTEQFVTNQLSYITNLYGPFITNNNLYSTNIYTTNLFATYVTNNTDYITNLYGPFITNDFIYTTNIFNSTAYVTNLYGPFITNFQLYSTDIFVTNLTANYITNLQDITTNLYVSNAFFTNLTVEFITNDFLFVTNLYNSNAFITNLTANYITNNTSYTTNLISSNIYTTNIFVMEASWFTNKWNGPTNDVSFTATYQNFVASTDMEITGFQNSIATNANTSVLLLDPGGATRTLYFPAPWTNFTSDGNNAYVIPKTNTAILTLFQYGNLYTNVTFRLFGSGTQNTVSNSMYGLGFVQTNDTRILAFAGPIYDTNLTPGLPVFAQGAGLLGTSNSIPAGVLPNDIAYTDKNNAFTTASSNYFAGAISISTNSCNGVPDFSVEESLFSTNNAIVFAAPIGVDTTKKTVQWLLVNTTNTTAAAVTVTPPANCHGVGTLYCTNWSQCWFQCYGGAITNMIVVPIF